MDKDKKQERELWLVLVGVLLGNPKLSQEVFRSLRIDDASQFDDVCGILYGLDKSDKSKVRGFLEQFGAVFNDECPAYKAVVEGLREQAMKRQCLLVQHRLAGSARLGKVAAFVEDLERELSDLRGRL